MTCGKFNRGATNLFKLFYHFIKRIKQVFIEQVKFSIKLWEPLKFNILEFCSYMFSSVEVDAIKLL